MAKTVHKYALEIEHIYPGTKKLFLPHGARFVHVHEQEMLPCVWVWLDPAQPADEAVMLTITPTGAPSPPDPVIYLGAAHVMQFVWHVWELPAHGE